MTGRRCSPRKSLGQRGGIIVHHFDGLNALEPTVERLYDLAGGLLGVPGQPVDVFHLLVGRQRTETDTELALEGDNGEGLDRVRAVIDTVGVDGGQFHGRRHYENALVTPPLMGQVAEDTIRTPTLPETGFQSLMSAVKV